jgi:hypothetical protein
MFVMIKKNNWTLKKKDMFLYLVLCTYLTLKKKDMFLYLVLCTYLTLKKKDMFLYLVKICTYLTLKKKDMFNLYLVLCTYWTLKKKDTFLYLVLCTYSGYSIRLYWTGWIEIWSGYMIKKGWGYGMHEKEGFIEMIFFKF